MGFFSAGSAQAAAEQAVIAHFENAEKDWEKFFEWEARLEDAVKKSGDGEYDGNELAADDSDGTIYLYGPDADRLFAVAKPYLQSAAFLKNIQVTLRYGDVKDKTARTVTLSIGKH
jgi:hypothetical protein